MISERISVFGNLISKTLDFNFLKKILLNFGDFKFVYTVLFNLEF